MKRNTDKERILSIMVSIKEVVSSDDRILLKKYFLDDLVQKKTCTQKELDDLFNIIFKLREIEELKKDHKCKFTNFEISILIKEGFVEILIFCIKSNCIADSRSRYHQLRQLVDEKIDEENLIPLTVIKKPKEDKKGLDTKKIAKIVNYINKNGSLTKEEFLVLSKLLGFKANSVQIIRNEEEKTL